MRRFAVSVLTKVLMAGCTLTPASPSPGDVVVVPLMTGSLAPGEVCVGVDLTNYRLIWDRDAGGVLLVHVGSGEVRSPVWPTGYSAVAVRGVLKLIASGEVVATEGDVFAEMGICGRSDGRVLVMSVTLPAREP